jgi:hypothetical protein
MAWDDSRSRMGACRLLSRCRTDVCDDCAVPRLFVDIVKLPLKPPQFMQPEGSVKSRVCNAR